MTKAFLIFRNPGYYYVCVLLSRFLTGPTNLKDPEAKLRFPKIFVSAEEGYEELHLIVYKVSQDWSDLVFVEQSGPFWV